MDLETAGAAATAGLVGAAIEKPAGAAGEAHSRCTDCGAGVIGRFCHQCGQPAHVHRSLLHLGEELLHGVMHFDGRIWRTLPLLLFRPGRLTREWVQGKRARYVSPLAMFLFTVFVMFMVLSFLPESGGPQATVSLAQAQTAAAEDLADERRQLAEAEAALAAATTPEARAEAAAEVADEREEVAEAEADVAVLKQVADLGIGSGDWRGVREALEQRAAAEGASAKTGAEVNVGNDELDKKIEKAIANPEYALYKLQQNFYKFSFLLVPISIPFVALLFLWKRGFTLYDHGVFVLYSLTFVSMLILATTLAIRANMGLGVLLASLLPFVVPAHMFFQLKGTYGLSAFSALWRTMVLLVFCNIALGLFGLAVVYLAFA